MNRLLHRLSSRSPRRRSPRGTDRGFTLIELLVTMAITTVILGSVMLTMTDAIRATESASQITNLNNGLRTAMDLMVRDMLQVGQGLPGGRAILVPNGAGSTAVQLPGPVGSDYFLDGPSFCPPAPPDDLDTVCEQIQAVIPGPGRGPVLIDGQPATDMITTLAADSAFDSVPLRAFAAGGASITVALPGANPPQHPAGRNISDNPDVDGDNIRPGDLIMLTKGSASALVQVSSVTGQQIFFAAADSLGLNQTAAADGTAGELRATDPIDTLTRPPCAPAPAPCDFVTTVATRIRMISYYLDAVTDPRRPRLVRRMNNSTDPAKWDEFDNNEGTAVAFDIEGLQITYDLSDDRDITFSNVRMDDADLDGSGACAPSPCYPGQIRKINIMLSARSRLPRRGTDQFFRNRLVTQVSLRSLAFVDRYR
jgi:prepilin-type N-terminal cleavage/methylation domain-containing protein